MPGELPKRSQPLRTRCVTGMRFFINPLISYRMGHSVEYKLQPKNQAGGCTCMLAKATTLDCGRLMNELCFLNPVPKSFKSTRISQRKRYSMECPFLCPLLAVIILTVSLTAQVRPRQV